MNASLCRMLFLLSPLALTACGDGWQAQKTTSHFPYGNERTAGSGVVYVRAKMMPEKELKLEPMAEVKEETPPAVEPEPVLDAEEIFEDAQTKGAPAKSTTSDAADEDHSAVDMEHEKKMVSSASSEVSAPELSAEEYIAQAPKEIETPDVDIIDDHPVKQVVDEEVAMHEPQAGDETNDVVEVYEGVIVQPVKEIVAPNKSIINGKRSPGQLSLDQIYNAPF